VNRLVEQSFYDILEIARTASAEEIERAYERALAMYGPDSLVTYTLLAPEDAELLARRIEDARTVLLDPLARASYDASLPGEAGRDGAAAIVEPGATAAPTRRPEAAAALSGASGGGGAHQAVPPVVQPPPFVPPEGSPWTGEILRQARESRGLTVHQVAERTKITRHHIENIEAERFDKLPVSVYLRGILLSLARELRLDGQKVARSYLDRVAAAARPNGKGR
jgi:curved DNA-binding protein CbpA